MNVYINSQAQASLRGHWTGGTTYTFFDVVLYNGVIYYALRENNGARPDISPQDWVRSTHCVDGEGGVVGTGPQGEQGIQGEQGEQGEKGEKGDTGEKGDMPTHIWDGTTLSFENPDGTFSTPVDLQGPAGSGSDIDLTPYATTEYVDSAVSGAVGDMTIAQLKGRVDTVDELSTEGAVNGDIWFVGLATDTELDEYIYFEATGTFEQFGSTSIDGFQLADNDEYAAGTHTMKAPNVAQVKGDVAALDTRLQALESATPSEDADLSAYATTESVTTALANKADTTVTDDLDTRLHDLENVTPPDLSAYASTDYVDTAIANIETTPDTSASTYPLVNVASGATAVTLTANTYTAIAGTVATLTITLPEASSTEYAEMCLVSFVTGATAPTVTLSDNVITPSDFSFESNSLYEVTFTYNHAQGKWLLLSGKWGV